MTATMTGGTSPSTFLPPWPAVPLKVRSTAGTWSRVWSFSTFLRACFSARLNEAEMKACYEHSDGQPRYTRCYTRCCVVSSCFKVD